MRSAISIRVGPGWLCALLVAACGSSGQSAAADEWAPGFAGLWYGTLVVQESGQPDTTGFGELQLLVAGHNDLVMGNYCATPGGPQLLARSSDRLEVQPMTCPPVAVTGFCPKVTDAVLDGSGSLDGDTLTLSLRSVSSGCEQSFPYTLAFSGTRTVPATARPVAIIDAPEGTLAVGRRAQLDGTSSSDPLGGALTYQWGLLRKPDRSYAQFSDSSAASPTFVPDVEGSYLITLSASSGTRTSVMAERQVFAANRTLPVATITVGPAGPAPVDRAVVLDASGSSGFGPVTFAWSLTSAPFGSTARLVDASSAIAHLTPDQEGAYTVEVTVSDSLGDARASATFAAHRAVTQVLDFRPRDARYSRALERLVATSDSPAQLHLVDPVTQQDSALGLPFAPRCLALSSDGLLAVVGHDAGVSYVDLSGPTLIKTWPLSADAGSIVLGEPITLDGRATRFAYVFPARDQRRAIRDLDLGNGAESPSGALVYPGSRAVLQPGTGSIFASTTSSSPGYLYRFDINPATGLTSDGTSSPSWDDPIVSGLWISSDGTQLLSVAGNRYRASDMTYAGKTPVGPLSWADWSGAAGRWVLQPALYRSPYPSVPPTDDRFFLTVDSQYLGSAQQTPLPVYQHGGAAFDVHGRFAFYDTPGTHVVVLAQIDAAANALNDFLLVRF